MSAAFFLMMRYARYYYCFHACHAPVPLLMLLFAAMPLIMPLLLRHMPRCCHQFCAICHYVILRY